MSSISTVEARRTAGPSDVRPVRPVVRPVRRDRRGPARPSPVAAHGATSCPSPVPGSGAVTVPAGLLRRVAAGVGLVLASAAAVVGLGLLADVSAVTPAQPGIAAGQP